MRPFAIPHVRLALLAAIVAASPSVVQAAAGTTVIPVILSNPSCEHEKMGKVTVKLGTLVTEATPALMIPTVSYERVFAKLAAAASEQGADAVVVRNHRATYFTRNARRSDRPVHVRMEGAMVRLTGDRERCTLVAAEPGAMRDRATHGDVLDVTSQGAYGD
ncbi:MAG: hypothetical protein M3Q40_08520 [Pseudomonadota bacterium]|nr:hypothetical protein [Pseudomonadota bacterium]